MRFWDSSAIVPLLIEEHATVRFGRLYGADGAMVVWWGTETECVAALARRERESFGAGANAAALAFARLDELSRYWQEITPVAEVRATARRLLRTHRLRAADSLQLAAALAACDGRTDTLEFVCADDQLVAAARLEGFPIMAPNAAREPAAVPYAARRKRPRSR